MHPPRRARFRVRASNWPSTAESSLGDRFESVASVEGCDCFSVRLSDRGKLIGVLSDFLGFAGVLALGRAL
jgi:hypothetical protein